MASWLRPDPWAYRFGFVVIAAVLLFVRLLPLPSVAGAFPGPDLLLCVMIAWTMRRPDLIPIWLIVPVCLLEDMLIMRPPGLWTALVVLMSEFLRSRNALTRDLNFIVEWFLAAGLMLLMLFAYRIAFSLALLPQPPFGFAAVQITWSIAAYPVVVFLSKLAFDLNKPASGQGQNFGRRL